MWTNIQFYHDHIKIKSLVITKSFSYPMEFPNKYILCIERSMFFFYPVVNLYIDAENKKMNNSLGIYGTFSHV